MVCFVRAFWEFVVCWFAALVCGLVYVSIVKLFSTLLLTLGGFVVPFFAY